MGLNTSPMSSNTTGDYNVHLQDTNGENLRLLTNHPTDEKDLTWSPDGRFLAYTSNQDGTYKIYVLGHKDRRTSATHGSHEREWTPAWSPDGNGLHLSLVIMNLFPGSNRNNNPHLQSGYQRRTSGAVDRPRNKHGTRLVTRQPTDRFCLLSSG